MDNNYLKNLKKLLFGSLFSRVAVFLFFVAILLIITLGKSENNYIAESAENLFYDSFFKEMTVIQDSSGKKDDVLLESKSNNDPSIIIADIDEKTLEALGNYYSWDRSIHAKVIENLSKGGAAAIAFDILFKDADFGKSKGSQCYENFLQLYPDSSRTDSIIEEQRSQIQSNYNFDSMLVEATRNSHTCIVSFLLNNTSYYIHKSDWEPLSTWDRAKEIGISSTFELGQVDKPQNVESRQLLDNVFPELANAGALIGAVNAYPDSDGVVRRINMLYKFPDDQIIRNDRLAQQRIYSSLSLMTILHLFHKDPKDVKIKMGEYIDIGKPFGIYRDSAGTYHTTFPNFTYPMFVGLRNKMKQIKASGVQKASQEETSYKVIAKLDDLSQITFDIATDEKQRLNATQSNLLRELPENIFDKLEQTEKIELDNGSTISKSEDDEGYYVITDEDDNEITITPNILYAIKFFEPTYKTLKPGESRTLSRKMDINYDKFKNEWSTSIGFFSNQILRDIAKVDDQSIEALKPGEELRFGPYKKIPINENGQYLIRFNGRFNNVSPQAKPFKHVPYFEIYSDSINLDRYAGKTVILGSSVSALLDIVNGPHEENIPAIWIHANTIKNILEDDYLTILKERYQCYIIILLAVICILIGISQRGAISFIFTLILIAAYAVLAYISFRYNVYIGVSRPIIAIIISNTFGMVIQAYNENQDKKRILEEKQFIRSTFQQYLSPEVIKEMEESGKPPELGGKEKFITAYFTDIQGFSTFSEKMGSAEKLINFLNDYLSSMTDILVSKNKGTLDKFEGDAIIAFFGAPVEYLDHAKRACDTALDMQNDLLRLRQKWINQGGWPQNVHDMHMRIGINTGRIVVGHVGTDGAIKRKSYTMIGDEVNLAARLESAAKQYGAYIQVSKNTIDQLVELGVRQNYIYRSLDFIRVVGKNEPVETFELLAYANDENAMILNKLCTLWEEARTAYLDMDWDRAIELFTQCLDFEPHLPERDPGSKTCPSQVYIKRCEAYKQNPPAHAGEKWDGIFTATEK